MTDYPDSTVAFTAFNVLVQAARSRGGPTLCDAHAVRAAAARAGHLYALEQIERALGKLEARGWIAEKGGSYAAKGPRLAVSRSRVDTEGSDPGWKGWLLEGGQPLETNT